MITFVAILAAILILCIVKINFFEHKVKNEKKITKKTKLQSLGELPFNENNGDILIENKPKANVMKYLRDIRANILKDTENKVISVISYNHGEGKSFIANNLAISISRLNKSVLLIDGNFREKSNKNETFYIEKGEGLVDFINSFKPGEVVPNLLNAKRYISQTQFPNLYVLQNGTITEDSYKLLETQKIKEVIELLKSVYDVILIDCTSFFETKDAFFISNLADTSIIVAENHITTYEDILMIKNQLENNDINLLGFILNKTNLEKGKYYNTTENLKYGMYAEAFENHYSLMDIDEIIDPITKRINSYEEEKYEALQIEFIEKRTEELINNMGEEFNRKIRKIEKENKKLIDKIEKLKQEVKEEKVLNETIRNKEAKGFEKFAQAITKKFKRIETGLNQLKRDKEYFEEDYDEKKIS